MPVVADTSFLIDLARRDRKAMALAQELGRRGETILVPSVALAEYAMGFAEPERAAREISQGAEIIPFTEDQAIAAADFGRRLAAQGKFPGWNDLFIGAVATERGGLRVVSRNPRHFPLHSTLTY